MKRYFKCGLIIILSLQYCINGYCQDVSFSQFYAQPLLRNPALAGIFTGDIRFTASYRNQWQSVTVPYRTFALSSEIKFPLQIRNASGLMATIGLQLMRDVAGTSEFSTTQVLTALNLTKRFTANSFLSFAFMGGLMQQRFDPSKLILNDQFLEGSDGSFSILPTSNQIFNNTSVNYFDPSIGASYNVTSDNTDWYVGVALFHVATKSVGFYEDKKIVLNKKFALNGGLTTTVGYEDAITLYGDIFHNKKVNTFQAGLLYTRNVSDDLKITFGSLYRYDDAIIPVVQLELSNFIIGTSYDVNVSKLTTASQARGGFELTLSYKNAFASRNPLITPCPRFGKSKSDIKFY